MLSSPANPAPLNSTTWSNRRSRNSLAKEKMSDIKLYQLLPQTARAKVFLARKIKSTVLSNSLWSKIRAPWLGHLTKLVHKLNLTCANLTAQPNLAAKSHKLPFYRFLTLQSNSPRNSSSSKLCSNSHQTRSKSQRLKNCKSKPKRHTKLKLCSRITGSNLRCCTMRSVPKTVSMTTLNWNPDLK